MRDPHTSVFRLRAVEGAIILGLAQPQDEHDFFTDFHRLQPSADWTPPDAYVVPSDDKSPGRPTDLATWVTGIPLLSSRAAEVLTPLVSSCARLLPVRSPGLTYHLVSVTCMLDALVESESSIFRYPSGGIGDIVRYALNPSALDGKPIFKLSQWPDGAILVTQSFVDTVTKAGLVGFQFKEVWPIAGTRWVSPNEGQSIPG